MTHDERIEKAVTKLEAAVDVFADVATDHEDRLRDLEANQNKSKGALYVLASLLTFGIGKDLFQWLR